MTTDTSEKGLERLICEAMTGAACDPLQGGMVRERPSSYGAGWNPNSRALVAAMVTTLSLNENVGFTESFFT